MSLINSPAVKLQIVDARFIDKAWKDGARELSEACDTSGGEITGDQLKMILARGERTLVRLDEDGVVVGWAVFRIDQLPNFRVFFITDLVARNCGFSRFFPEVKLLAAQLGCSRIRCAAKEAQARLYLAKCSMKPVYQVLEIEL